MTALKILAVLAVIAFAFFVAGSGNGPDAPA